MKKNIFTRMTKNSYKRDKFGTISFSIFITISVMLFSLSVLLFSNLTGAIDNLMNIAQTPDFLQMHDGQLNEEEINSFVSGRTDIKASQISKFLNLENSTIFLGDKSLKDSTQDNGLSVQGNGFDYMLDLDNAIPKVKEGEVYVPASYQKQYDVQIGDEMKIGNDSLTIVGFIRDSQMNSMMASSKRFLVCESDYEKIKSQGSEEYLIEFLLKEGADISAFQTEYENSGLPKNGPTITRPLVKMMNALSDGIMIMIILLISLLVLIISLICIRFMLLTRIETEQIEVGVLKAIGISRSDIKSMFIRRYMLLIVVGGVFGLIFSFILYQPLSIEMQRLYGISEHRELSLVLSIVGGVILSVVILLYITRLLKKLNQMTAIKALTGREENKKSVYGKLCISVVVAIGVFLMIIPANLYSTLSSEKFITYMGIGDSQFRIDIRQTDNIGEKIHMLSDKLEKDESVEEYTVYQTRSIPAKLTNGELLNIIVEQGDHNKFPVTYSKGSSPKNDGEIALSYLLAKEINASVGDSLSLNINGNYSNFNVTGIYSDITNGGKTAKMYQKQSVLNENVMWSIAYVTLKDKINENNWINNYNKDGIEVINIKSYVKETYGQTILQVRAVSLLVKFVSATIMILVISLFLRLLISKDKNDISIKKAIGFITRNIKTKYAMSSLYYCFGGIIFGILTGSFLGQKICTIALRSFGADGFKFIINPIELFIYIPIISIIGSIFAIVVGIKEVKNISAVECCRRGA